MRALAYWSDGGGGGFASEKKTFLHKTSESLLMLVGGAGGMKSKYVPCPHKCVYVRIIYISV